jgi:hypothetical protein
MPCQSWTPAEEAAYEIAENHRRYGLAVSTASLATRIVCELGQLLRDNYARSFAMLPKYTLDFLNDHWEADRKEKERREREEMRKQKRSAALAKLTAEEREVLGLDKDG